MKYKENNSPYIGQRFHKLVILEIYPKTTGYSIKCLCDCGKTIVCNFSRIKSGHIHTCCKCNEIKIGDRFGRLIVTRVPKNPSHNMVELLCDCGNKCRALGCALITKNTQSCGCYRSEYISKKSRKNYVGIKVGKLEVLEFNGVVDQRTTWKARCDCGNVIVVVGKQLTTKSVQSCGNCQLLRNGKKTSFKALELHKMVGHGIHNFKTKLGYYVDIAFVINGRKIAIEYDEWIWHGNKLEKDKKRLEQLRQNGWRTLQIKAHKNLPTQKQLDKAIYDLAYTDIKKRTITLNGWGDGTTRF